MSGFGWTRLAYLLAVLAVLTALVRLAEPASPGGTGEPERVGWSAEDPAPESTASEPREPPRGDVVSAPRASSRDPASAPAYAAVSRRKSPPVFYRPVRREPAGSPSADRPTPAPQGPADRVCRSVGQVPEGVRIVFPVPEEHSGSYEDTWGAPRPQGGHEGTDLMVPEGTPLYAMTAGTVVPVAGSNGNGWNTLGGYAVMIRAYHSIGPVREGDLFYYAHLRERSPLDIGGRVRPGEVVGFAGDTGEGPEGTRGRFPPHLHLGWYDGGGGRSQLASGAMNPYPLLEWIREHGGSISGGSDARYCIAPQEGPPVPSVGGTGWLYPDSPGERPDLDTGSSSPHPSPVVRRPRSSAERAPVVEKVPSPRKERPQLPNRSSPEPEERPRPPSPPEKTAGAVFPEKTETTTASRRLPAPSLPSAQEIREWVLTLIPRPSKEPDRTPPERAGELTAPERAPAEPCGRHRPCREDTEPESRQKKPRRAAAGEEETTAPETAPESATTGGETTASEAGDEPTSSGEGETTAPESGPATQAPRESPPDPAP
ncbi:hypothetical protein RxyAA322_00910 [Rubrobacter xylanophilus]|uniref:M23ase beta-sheet core domain-containing protein n=1 Tax=Rubrobacter xylanophilus TaxID=49319 RepID=A0A510HIQ4_9ACTN|nr:M23 family metallopeptidase [Rubrobacter xylanophilus]BBL78237.1 hypothetical protein RxyAA322_00910 [Rubrobacter xylanophilus]